MKDLIEYLLTNLHTEVMVGAVFVLFYALQYSNLMSIQQKKMKKKKSIEFEIFWGTFLGIVGSIILIILIGFLWDELVTLNTLTTAYIFKTSFIVIYIVLLAIYFVWSLIAMIKAVL